MNIKILITEKEIKELVLEKLRKLTNFPMIDEKDIKFLVKTTQNYKAEWETGEFKVEIEYDNKFK